MVTYTVPFLVEHKRGDSPTGIGMVTGLTVDTDGSSTDAKLVLGAGVMFGFRRNPDVAGNGRSEGWKRVRPIAIDYRTVTGTAGAGYKGDRRLKGPDSRSLERTPMALWRHKGGET